MSFFELVGAILVFGLAFMYVPRVAFIVTLVVALRLSGFHFLFLDHYSLSLWEWVSSILLLVAFIVSILFDWYYRDDTHEKWKR
ncbi:MAG: hypothetical protein WCV80_03070 [Candidatus Paceibacterota bacterium]|jgi:hypothetical protein